MEASKADVSVVVVPSPVQGHLNPFLHFSILLSSHGLNVHYAGPTAQINQAKSRLQGWHAAATDSIHFHDLPIPPFTSPAPNPNSSISFPSHLQLLLDTYEDSRPHFSYLLRSLSATSRRVIVVSDLIVYFSAAEAAALPNGEAYTFRCVPPSLDIAWEGQDGPEGALLKSLGLKAPSTEDCITEEFHALIARNQNKPESGILTNTCHAIEGEFLDYYKQQQDLIGKKVFAIGPLNPTVITETKVPRHHCLDWLDKQPPSSVLYVSFGSNSSISDAQIEQLATGLLNSGQNFIWVLREADRGDCFTERENVENRLPKGFMEKIEGKGIILTDWAPQLEILSHKAIACFLSHCGWNSCVESISMGVPLLTWPMHSDQPWNSVLVSNYLKVGMIIRDWDRRKEILSATEIENAIKDAMVSEKGEEIRRRATELGVAVRSAASEANSDLISFIKHITRP